MSVLSGATGGAVSGGVGTWLSTPPHERGLGTEAVYLYATLRGAAGLITVTRRLAVDGGPGLRRLMLRTVPPRTGRLQPHPAGRTAPSSTGAVLDVDAGDLLVRSVDGHGFAARAGQDAMRWTEGDLLRLTGTACGPGLWWATDGMGYAGWMYRVTGRVLGADVTGLAGVDQVRLRPGAALYVDDPLTEAGEPAIWSTFATAYADGSADYGHVLLASDGTGFAVLADGGEVMSTSEVTGAADPDGAAAELHVAGESWSYRADPAGLVPPVPGDPMVRSEGSVRRASSSQPAVAQLAALELGHAGRSARLGRVAR